jgi:hypothetical protein
MMSVAVGWWAGNNEQGGWVSEIIRLCVLVDVAEARCHHGGGIKYEGGPKTRRITRRLDSQKSRGE